MSRRLAATLVKVIAWSVAMDAAAERPRWLDRAEKSVARLRVPPSGDVQEGLGTGLVVGFDGTVLYLITAGHVIWPNGISSSDNVNVEVELPTLCGSKLDGMASPERATPQDDMDLAVVTVVLGEGAPKRLRAECPGVLERVRELPAQIIDPRAVSFRSGTPGWIIARGETGGRDVLNVQFRAQFLGQIRLLKTEGVKPGNSGAPLFSEHGHLIGMIVTDDAESAATSYGPILNMLVRWGDVRVDLAGEHTDLTFPQELKGGFVSVAGRPLELLSFPQPSPRGDQIPLKLQIKGRPEVSGFINVHEPSMVCKVTWVGELDTWAVSNQKTTFWVALGLAAVGVAAGGIAYSSRQSFEHSPSRTTLDLTNTANLTADIASGGALLAGALSGYGYLKRNDSSGVACSGEKQ